MMNRAGKQKTIIVLESVVDGKASLVVMISPDLVASGFNAVDLVRTGAALVGGKGGGGRPDLAQAGGPDGSKAQDALQSIREAFETLQGTSLADLLPGEKSSSEEESVGKRHIQPTSYSGSMG